MKNKILIDKINNEKTLNVYMFIFLNLLITTPFLIAVYCRIRTSLHSDILS